MAQSAGDPTVASRRALLEKLDGVGWGLFFVWMGVAFLADVGWGAGLLGVGLIALGAQGVRRSLGIPVDRFGLVIGVVFAVWGLGELFDQELGGSPIARNFLPLLSIVLGVGIGASALRRKPRS